MKIAIAADDFAVGAHFLRSKGSGAQIPPLRPILNGLAQNAKSGKPSQIPGYENVELRDCGESMMGLLGLLRIRSA